MSKFSLSGKGWRSLSSFARRKLDWLWKEDYWLRNKDSVSCDFWAIQFWDTWNCNAMSSKATKRFVLVPADVYFAEARRDLVGLHSASVLDPSEPKKIRLSQIELDRKLLEKKKAPNHHWILPTKQLNWTSSTDSSSKSQIKKTELATVRSA